MNILSFLMYCIVVTATPGPTNIAILSIATNFGIRKTFQYMAGAALALLTLLALSVFFNSALAGLAPKVMGFMQAAGGLYMLFLAYQVLKMDVSGSASSQAATFVSGYAMQFVNPKIWLLTMTVIPSYIMPHYKTAPALLAFALSITVIALFAFFLWALFGTVLMRCLQKYRKVVNMALALLLLYSAIEVSGILGIIAEAV